MPIRVILATLLIVGGIWIGLNGVGSAPTASGYPGPGTSTPTVTPSATVTLTPTITPTSTVTLTPTITSTPHAIYLPAVLNG